MNKSKSFLMLLASGALSLCALAANAQQEQRSLVMQERKPQVWVNAGLLSFHLDRSKDYREFNYGLGAEVVFTPEHALMVGAYNNSESHWSKYVGYQYRPFQWKVGGFNVAGGLALSLIDGYPSMSNKRWFIAPFPVVAVEGEKFGANFVLIPNFKHGGALGMQLKMKF